MEPESEQASGSGRAWLGARTTRRRVLPLVRGVAFYGAIFLPWLVLALVLRGVATSDPQLFTGVVLVTLLSTVAGRNHERS